MKKFYKKYTFNEINKGKYSSVKHFESNTTFKPQDFISNHVKISVNRNYAKSKPDYWLYTRNNNKWNKNCLTGLFKTKFKNYYYGDINKRQHLVIFYYNPNDEVMKIYLFPNHYTTDYTGIIQTIIK